MSEHVYYKIEITLESSLSVGSGANDKTDHDIIHDSNGNPIIPATTLAGVYRSCLTDKEKRDLFGYVDKKGAEESLKKTDEEYKQSPVFVYDARLIEGSRESIRNCVSLDKYKTSTEGKLFDFEILEKGAQFCTYIEIDKNNYTEEKANAIKRILSKLQCGRLALGAKITRGYGLISLKVSEKKFMFPDELNNWLKFDIYDNNSWNGATPVALENYYERDEIVISLKLNLIGGISIRQYSTDVYLQETAPDSVQLYTYDKSHRTTQDEPGIPVIPGTSWSGAFRHRCSTLGYNIDSVESMFGYVSSTQKETAKKSRITFSESYMRDGNWKTITHNSINRFSGGTRNRALYTENSYFGGNCDLEIRLRHTTHNENSYILACILDLNFGFLSVGGLTAVGRGLFKIESMKINGEEQSLENPAIDYGGELQWHLNGQMNPAFLKL